MLQKRLTVFFTTLSCLTSSFLQSVPVDALYVGPKNQPQNWNAPVWVNSNVPTDFTIRAPGVGPEAAAGGDIAIFNGPGNLTLQSTDQIVLGALIGTFQQIRPFIDFSLDNVVFKSQNTNPAQVILINAIVDAFPSSSPSLLTLSSPLSIDLTNSAFHLKSQIVGPFGVTVNSNRRGEMILEGSILNTGPYIFNRGQVALNTLTGIPSDVTINRADIAALSSNQFSPSATLTMNGGSLALLGDQTVNRLIISNDGRVFEAGSLTVLEQLAVKGARLDIQKLNMPNGGEILYDRNLPGSGKAIFEGFPMVLDLGNHTLNLNIEGSSTQPGSSDVFDVAFRNLIVANGSLRKIGSGRVLFGGESHINFQSIEAGTVLFGLNQGETTFVTNPNLTINPGITIGGFGTLSGPRVVNNGIIEPGSDGLVGTLTLQNGLTNNGVVLIKALGTGVDRIVSNDFVQLGGELIVTGTPTFPVGTSVSVLETPGSFILGNFAEFHDLTASNTVVSYDLVGGTFQGLPNAVVVTFAPSPQAEVSAAYDAGYSQTTYRVEGVLARLGQVRGNTPSASAPLTASADHPRGNRQIDAGRFWAKPVDKPATIYISPLGSWGKVDSISVQKGFDFHSVGGLIGGDYAFDRAGVGALIGYEWFKGTEDCNYGNFRTRSLFGELYGTFLPLPNRNFFIDLIGGGSRNWYTFNRSVACGTAQGKPRGWEYDGYAGIGYNFNMRQEWRFAPIAGVQYMQTRIDSFTESGAGSNNLIVSEFKKRSLRSWVGATFGGRLERSRVIWMPEARGYWLHEFADLSRCLSIFSPCDCFCKTFPVFTGDRNYGIIGGELRALFGPGYRWIVSGAYDYLWSRHFSVNSVYATLGINF